MRPSSDHNEPEPALAAKTIVEVLLSSDLLETLPDAIVAVDRDGTIVQVNSQAQDLFGYDRNELIGQEVEMLVPESYRRQHHHRFVEIRRLAWIEPAHIILGGDVIVAPHRMVSQRLGVLGVMFLYMAVNFVYLHALGADGLAQTTIPASSVMRLALGERGASLIAVGIAISTLGFLSQGMLTAPRVYFAMAEDGLFFKSVAWLDPRTREAG